MESSAIRARSLATLQHTNSSARRLIVSSLHCTTLSSITCMPFRPQIRAQFNALCCVPHYKAILGTSVCITYVYVYVSKLNLPLISPSATFILMVNKNCKSIYCVSYLLCIAWHVLYATVEMHINV